MARVYKKPLYRPVPESAKIICDIHGKKYAYWIQGGEEVTAEYVESKNGPRIVEESEFYIARYTDATGRFRERSTGCRDLRAAQHKLNTWLQEIEKVKSGILTQEEFEVSKQITGLIEEKLDLFTDYLTSKGVTEKYKDMVLSRIRLVCNACCFKRMTEMNSTPFVRWLNKRGVEGMGARTRNAYREAMITFANWAILNKCLANNPFSRIAKAQESCDKRHERRALTVEEIIKLLKGTASRPLADQTKNRRAKNDPNPNNITPFIREKLIRLGWERKLIYSTLIYTGLRKSELASITVGQVFLDCEIPHIILKAKDEKSRRGATLPLHPELVSRLRPWLKTKRTKSEKLFEIPAGLSKILNRDLVFSGIEKRDFLGRVIDVHSLRHTHATLLALKNVSPAVAKDSMRHSDIRLTMQVYTHLKLGQIADGVNQLPNFMTEADE